MTAMLGWLIFAVVVLLIIGWVINTVVTEVQRPGKARNIRCAHCGQVGTTVTGPGPLFSPGTATKMTCTNCGVTSVV